MLYEIKPLACDPTAINGMSERLIVSHYENNYGGAVQRLNAITRELAELDFTSAPILALDMYEHSYHIDYGAQAAAYVDAFMAAINWPSVAAAYARLTPAG